MRDKIRYTILIAIRRKRVRERGVKKTNGKGVRGEYIVLGWK